MLLAAGPAFALSFTLFFFGPLDLAYLSRTDITYSPLEILPVTALVIGIVFLALLLAASGPGGKLHAFLVSIYTGGSLATYIQGAFLNPDLGTLDGHTVIWTQLSTAMLVNLAVWFFILLVPHLIHYFSNRAWRRFVMLASAALIIMQGVSLSVKMIDQKKIDRENAGRYYLSKENLFHPGKQKNVVIFLLDTVSNKDIERITDAYPDILYQFRDFTRFDNANTRFMYTVPSVIDCLTSYDPEFTNFDVISHLEEAWKNPKAQAFYSELKSAGFQTNLFVPANLISVRSSDLLSYASNLKEYGSDISINRTALQNLFKLSFYRYLPIAAKPFFNLYTDDINQVITNPNALVDQWDFVKQIMDTDLVPGDSDNVFSFYYLHGTHTPFTLNARGLIEGSIERQYQTNAIEQGAGFLNLLGLYMWRMKEKGIYDDSVIIVLADHGSTAGNFFYDPQPIFWIKPPNQRQEAMEITHAPITIQTGLIPTIADILGFSAYDYGETVFDVEDKPVERWTRIYSYDENYPAAENNRNNVIYEYHYEGNREDLIEAFRGDDVKIYPMSKNIFDFLELISVEPDEI